jgi:hypothetical protein
MPRPPKSPPHLQEVEDANIPLDIPEEEKPAVMAEREFTTTAFRQLGAPISYCLKRQDKPLARDENEQLHQTDENLARWREDTRKQGLNACIFLQQGVVEVRFFGPDQTINECFFAACPKAGITPRYAIGRRSKEIATSVLFKLRDDEARRLDDDYSTFRPKAFSVDDTRRGVVINFAPPIKKGSNAHQVTALLPGSLLWNDDGVRYDLFVWRADSGRDHPVAHWAASAPAIEFFQIVRAATYASVLNIVPRKTWEDQAGRRAFCEWLARLVRDGQAINANALFSRSSRAIIADPKHAEDLIELICKSKSLEAVRAECVEIFRFARKRLEADPTRLDVTGWSGIGRIFGEEAKTAFRTVLNVGADSTLLESFAERYLFCEGQFIDRLAFKEGRGKYIFPKDDLALLHAPDLIQTKKKAVEAFPIFIKSKMRQDVTGVDIFPDHPPGAVIRVTREGAIIPDDAYAPEHSRLIFNEWSGLFVKPAKTIEEALKAECLDKLDHMLSLVTNRRRQRADWVKAHLGWTLKKPGQKQQVALVCTGDQGTGKSFLCTTFAKAIFGKYAGMASVRALSGQFYIGGYTGKLWVSHDEYVSNFDNAEILKTLIRGVEVSGELKGENVTGFKTFARLAFTSNEANPGISRGRDDRGLFQVTSITAAGEGMLPGEFQDRLRKEVKPFYESFDMFLQRDDVRAAYVRLLIDCAPARLAEVEDLTYSAMRDEEVARAHLTPVQLIAKTILEEGTIYGGYDIAMPFRDPDLFMRVQKLGKTMGIRNLRSSDIVDEFFNAGLLDRRSDGGYLFKFKIGALQRLYSVYLGVPLFSRWNLEPNDDMPNDWTDGDPLEFWKGKR